MFLISWENWIINQQGQFFFGLLLPSSNEAPWWATRRIEHRWSDPFLHNAQCTACTSAHSRSREERPKLDAWLLADWRNGREGQGRRKSCKCRALWARKERRKASKHWWACQTETDNQTRDMSEGNRGFGKGIFLKTPKWRCEKFICLMGKLTGRRG